MGAFISAYPAVNKVKNFFKNFIKLLVTKIVYLSVWYRLTLFTKTRKRRFDLYKPNYNANPYESGLLPLDKEWSLDASTKTRNEIITIYGVNTSGQSFHLRLEWQPLTNNSDQSYVTANFTLKDINGYVYQFNESEWMNLSKLNASNKITEYKVGGLVVQVLSPFRRWRICFRGYLKRNKNDSNRKLGSDGEIFDTIYTQIRFYWIPLSNVFDFTSDFDRKFIAKELSESPNSRLQMPLLQVEDSFEQFGQIKGTIELEKEKEAREIFLWGSRRKQINKNTNNNINQQFTRVVGYNKKGIGFHVGFVNDQLNNLNYRYGFVYWGDVIVLPITRIVESNSKFNDFHVLNNITTTFTIQVSGPRKFSIQINKSDFNSTNNERNILINGHEGNCFIINDDNQLMTPITTPKIINNTFPSAHCNELVLSLADERAQNVSIAGGKGASLASLMKLSASLHDNDNNQFIVPRGIVVTTNAYNLLTQVNVNLQNRLNEFQKLVWSSKDQLNSQVKNACEEIVALISNHELPEAIKLAIKQQLKQVFHKMQGTESNFLETSFAVRSSTITEDSEEMSSAGQMETFLGVKGLENIYNAVMKCWASQFDFVAVQYKRGYGQLINTPMSVVIQEMVNCDAAGVMFTSDPITGDERSIIITANYGLGESVVSAASEPDTIKLKVDIDISDTYQKSVSDIESISIGSKKKLIKLGETFGTTEAEILESEAKKCCLTNENAIKLGQLGLVIHGHYGQARDIEWGIKDGELYMLQSRPITSVERAFTEWELLHELDTAHSSENEFYSSANVGEVLPGATSHLGLTFMLQSWTPIIYRRTMTVEGADAKHYCPYWTCNNPRTYGVTYNQYMFSLKSASFSFTAERKTAMSKAIEIGIFGREMTDPELVHECRNSGKIEPPPSKFNIYRQNFHSYANMMFYKIKCRLTRSKFRNYDFFAGGKFNSASELFDFICANVHQSSDAFLRHIDCFVSSSMFNTMLMAILAGNKAENPELLSDFAKLLANCNEVVSADVPKDMREITKLIENPEKFRAATDEEALKMLMSANNSECALKFKEFIIRHGHRGYNEYDLISQVWEQNPTPVIKSIKALLMADKANEKLASKKVVSVDDILGSLKTPLTWGQKFWIRRFVLRWCRDAVGLREQHKDLLIWMVNWYRRAFCELGRRMAYDEGRIPDPELVFHLNFCELKKLVTTRDPLLVAKAKHRQRIYHGKTRKFKFDEIVRGPNIKPRNEDQDNIINSKLSNNLVRVKGTPVCVGKVKGRACVVTHADDAVDVLKPGDILITYSTDIGWSPYFPLLSGLATEIGGLVSHGAVIAREFGLPCLIGVEGACKLFKTGDFVSLDAETGEIVKIPHQTQVSVTNE